MSTTADKTESFTPARLIPVTGIKNAAEAEGRATSALLAVLGAVDEFGREIIKLLGGHVGTIETYIEPSFSLGKKPVRPDGLIRVTRGKRVWTALVEVKTGKNDLKGEQLNNYLDVAKAEGYDAVWTISNQIVAIPGEHPTAGEVDKRKLRGDKIQLVHLSWARIVAIALTVQKHKGVDDQDQEWILGELIRYLEYPKSGAVGFETMGPAWVSVKDAVRQGTLRSNDSGTRNVAGQFDALLRYIGLRLGQQLGEEITLHLTRKEISDPRLRNDQVVKRLLDDGVLVGALSIPDTVGTLSIAADIPSGQTTCSVKLDAPETGRNRTRVNWLLRQLKKAPGDTRVEAHFKRMRGSTALLLDEVREDPDKLLEGMTDKEVSSFTIARISKMGIKRDVGAGSFITTTKDAVDNFYANILQSLKSWTPPAPKLPKESPTRGTVSDREETLDS